MVKHGMDVLQSITAHLNSGQIPVMTFDQPLFALAKFVQWCWPDTQGSGGAVGLTKNPSAFRRWMVAGPEKARILTEFESQFLESKEHSNQQHKQSHSTQQLFKKQVNKLYGTVSSMGNPFMDDSPGILILDTRNCTNDAVVSTVRTIEELGSTQYQQYVTTVIKNRTASIFINHNFCRF